MTTLGHGDIKELRSFDDPETALARIIEIYDESKAEICGLMADFVAGSNERPAQLPCYPYVGVSITADQVSPNLSGSYGNLPRAGTYGTTLTRPRLFESYYREQLSRLIRNHEVPIQVGISNTPIPLPFVVEAVDSALPEERTRLLQDIFPIPDLSRIDDSIVNGTYKINEGEPKPLALFPAERVDYSLVRLQHYTATAPEYFQRFVVFTNYPRYVEEFIEFGRKEVLQGSAYKAFVEPGNFVTHNPRLSDQENVTDGPRPQPQMPAYHLMRDRHEGITLVNIGVGPSNAKTITDHVAVLRPHCWMMVGHCGGLRQTQQLGDYVLAHAYARYDNVLDEDLPPWVPVPPIAEVQVALAQAVADVTGLSGREVKRRLRTGTVFTTDDRDWELRLHELARRFHLSRGIAVDMESATIAANGYRFRVPYGTLLCVSDKPLHGELKLPGMAQAFYRERVGQHLRIGIEAVKKLRDGGVESLHSRKLRTFDEPGFR
ncbi:MAG: AMP nucleosidase [Pseudomonadota bacterium]